MFRSSKIPRPRRVSLVLIDCAISVFLQEKRRKIHDNGFLKIGSLLFLGFQSMRVSSTWNRMLTIASVRSSHSWRFRKRLDRHECFISARTRLCCIYPVGQSVLRALRQRTRWVMDQNGVSMCCCLFWGIHCWCKFENPFPR